MVYSLYLRSTFKLCLQSTVYRNLKKVWSLEFGVGSFLLLFFLLTPLSSLFTVSAHVLKTDGTIGAVLHIDPEDDPIVNQPAGFFFEFKDTQNKFDPANCDCNFTILQEGKQIYNQPLFQNNQNPALDNASVFYTFPEKDVYQIIVSGTPKTTGAFSNFKLVFDIRVARGESIATSNAPVSTPSAAPNWFSTPIIYILIGVVILVALVIFVFAQNAKKSKTPTSVSVPTPPTPEPPKSAEPSNQKPDVK